MRGKKHFSRAKAQVSLVATVVLVVIGALFGAMAYQEWVRLAREPQVSLLQYPGRKTVTEGFTHASGAAMSIYANGQMNDMSLTLYMANGKGRLAFPKGGSVQYELEATFLKYESDISGNFQPQRDFKDSFVIDSTTINKGKAADSLCVRCSGRLFVAYLKLSGIAEFPKEGFISVIVH